MQPAVTPSRRRSHQAARRGVAGRLVPSLITGLALLASVVCASISAAAATVPSPAAGFPDNLATTSQSGQFVVTGPRVPGLSPPREFQPGSAPRTLTPQTLAVACERIKEETLRLLALPDVWRHGGGTIHIAIESTQRTNAPVPIEAAPYENGLKFRVSVPTSLAEERLTRAVVQAVVLDLANRTGNQRVAEPPLWLVEGITQSILQTSVEGTLPAPETRTSLEIRRPETLARVREQMARANPPSFYELSQPDLSTMSDRDWSRFSAGSQLCLHELRRMPEGETRLRNWILHLQDFWNWQTGFIEAFQPHFRSLLDTEKWWAITVANFTGRDAAQAWPADFTLRKLDEALRPVGVLPSAGNRAQRLPLEDIINAWDFPRQGTVLRQLVQQLHAIRVNAAPNLRPLLYRYIDVIESYMESRSRVGLSPAIRGQPMANPKLLARETVRRLRELDGERAQALQDLATPAPSPAADPSATPAKPAS